MSSGCCNHEYRPSSPKTPPTPRYTSYSKRYTSPRDIPLPSTPTVVANNTDSYFSQDTIAPSASASALVDTRPQQPPSSPSWRDRIPFYDRRLMRDDESSPSSSSDSSVASSSSSSSSSFTSAGSVQQTPTTDTCDDGDKQRPPSPSSWIQTTTIHDHFYPTAMRRSSPAYSLPSSLVPPEPPRILENDPVPSERIPAPYEFFLNSRGPQPADSWLDVETFTTEYRLFARLPGFSREGITLATKRRRILHLVADKWDNGGGHFERRISFGYDADLVQVRAEFDGEMLRVTIPRRQPAWSSSRIAYSGRA